MEFFLKIDIQILNAPRPFFNCSFNPKFYNHAKNLFYNLHINRKQIKYMYNLVF